MHFVWAMHRPCVQSRDHPRFVGLAGKGPSYRTIPKTVLLASVNILLGYVNNHFFTPSFLSVVALCCTPARFRQSGTWATGFFAFRLLARKSEKFLHVTDCHPELRRRHPQDVAASYLEVRRQIEGALSKDTTYIGTRHHFL